MKNLIISLAMIFGLTAFGSAANIGKTTTTHSILTVREPEPIKLSSLPKDARQFMKENYPVRAVTYVAKTKNDKGEALYEVGVKLDGKLSIVQFDAKGELVSERMAGK